VPGPLAIDPPFDKLEYSSWSGVHNWENVISDGWSADSTTFALCHRDMKTELFTKGCDLIHVDGSPPEHVTSTTDYNDGHSATSDATIDARFKPLGIPAPPGKWPYSGALTLTWSAHVVDDLPDTLTFSLRDDTSGKQKEIARFTKDEGGYAVFPREAIVSPDGQNLALVVSYIGAPPLFTAVKIVSTATAAKSLSAK
jgi:hypothetical protein